MIRIWDPTVESKPPAKQLARPLCALQGARLGLLDNGKSNSNHLLQFLRDMLEKKDHVTTTVSLVKPNFSMLAPRFQIEQLARQCDFVITGVGD